MRTMIPFCAAAFVFLGSVAGAATLENQHVKITIDVQHGGAVAKMVYKQAPTVPFVADRGAGIAGQGRLLLPRVAAGEQRLSLADVTMQVAPTESAGQLTLTADLSRLAAGLRLQRRFELADDESGLRITDTFSNGGAAETKLRIGAVSRIDGQPWNKTLRCWFGDGSTCRWMFTPYGQGTASQLQSASPRLFWRAIGQYGTGLLYLPEAPATPVNVELRLPKEAGYSAEFEWTAAEIAIPAGGQTAVRSTVLIDTGGREGGSAAALLQADRVIVHGDVQAAGRRGEVADCFVTVTSAVPRRVRVVVTERTLRVNWGKERDQIPPRQIAALELDLRPGQGAVRHIPHTPATAGLMYLRFEVQDPAGKVLASTEGRAVIDGDAADGEFAQTWQRYVRKLPEVHLRGTWEEIGRQMARLKAIGPALQPEHAKARLELYEKRFPFYARLLRGAAAELGKSPDQLADARQPRAPSDSCMGLVVHGPEGPIHLYSKERGGSSLRGMGYLKVVPDAGYRYHMYTLNKITYGYGVNEAGLSTSGATINCDSETDRVGQEETRRRAAEGKATVPVGMHMLLAMCADVDEAIRLIDDSDAPLDFTGNMLIADRKGQAAVLESVGTYHQIIRGEAGRLLTTGNYPHRRPDGRFAIGNDWGWAANTMLRELLVGKLLDGLGGQATLSDARMIMGTRAEPGGMCQHSFDNVGTLYSTCSAIAVLRTGDFYISHGPPSQVQYVRYRLAD